MANTYFPLHTHSHYSLLDGLSKPQQIAKRCIEAGLPGSVLTDHGSISGAVAFMNAMEKRTLKPIMGCEMYVHDGDTTVKDGTRNYSHMLVIAKDLDGWKQLVQLTSEANHPDNFYYKPRINKAMLAKYASGGKLIGISGHLGSSLSHCIFQDPHAIHDCLTPDDAKKFTYSDWAQRATREALELQDIFGKGNFFIEIQVIDNKTLPAVALLATALRYISKKTGIPCVATPDAHYATQGDCFDQRVLLCSSLGVTFKEVNHKMVKGEQIGLGTFFKSHNYHIPSYDEMIEAGHTEEELGNTLLVADMCSSYSLKGKPMLPKFPCPDSMTSDEYLRKLCREGWTRRWPLIEKVIQTTSHTKEEYAERFEKEFKVLTEVGLADYFLIVNDIINFAHNDGQLTGSGRGSAAGSLALYLLGVTHVDAVEYDLLFERFYNAGRNTKDHVAFPDVDMDFEKAGRGRIIDYIRSRYGNDRVSQMLTFTRLQGRGAMKEVLRAHGACSFEEMNSITEYIPDEAEISDQLEVMREADRKAGGDGEASIIEWALENRSKELKPWAFYDDAGNIQGPMAKFFEQAIRIEGTKKSQSKHASGIVISNEPLAQVCPMLYDRSTGEMVAGMEMGDLEMMGHIKFDILGVTSLDKIHGVLNLLRTGRLRS